MLSSVGTSAPRIRSTVASTTTTTGTTAKRMRSGANAFAPRLRSRIAGTGTATGTSAKQMVNHARTFAPKSGRTIVRILTPTGATTLPWKRRRIGTTAKAALIVKTARDIAETSRRLAKRQLVVILSRRRRIRG